MADHTNRTIYDPQLRLLNERVIDMPNDIMAAQSDIREIMRRASDQVMDALDKVERTDIGARRNFLYKMQEAKNMAIESMLVEQMKKKAADEKKAKESAAV